MRLLALLALSMSGLTPFVASANDWRDERGLSFICELRDRNLADGQVLAGSPIKITIWFGRFRLADKETGGKPISLINDRSHSLAQIDAPYSTENNWPIRFVIQSRGRMMTSMLIVSGEKAIDREPGKFEAMLGWHDPVFTPQDVKAYRFLVGTCAVVQNDPYREYLKRIAQ